MKAYQQRIQQYQMAAALAANQGNSLASAAVAKANGAQGSCLAGFEVVSLRKARGRMTSPKRASNMRL